MARQDGLSTHFQEFVYGLRDKTSGQGMLEACSVRPIVTFTRKPRNSKNSIPFTSNSTSKKTKR